MATFTIEVSEAEKYIIDVNTSTADSFTSSSSQDKFYLEIEQGIAGTAETTKNIIEITTSVDSASSTNSITIEKVNDINLVITTDFIIDHPTISAASSVDNDGNLFIQDIFLDQYGHITGINSAYATGTGIGGGASTFLDLTDTPSTFSGNNSKVVAVNSSASALEFISGVLISGTDYHPSINAASSSDNSGQNFIQDILLDNYGHITGIVVATASGTGIVSGSDIYITGITYNSSISELVLTHQSGSVTGILNGVVHTGDLSEYATTGELNSVSGYLQDQIDNIPEDTNTFITGIIYSTEQREIVLSRNDGASLTGDIGVVLHSGDYIGFLNNSGLYALSGSHIGVSAASDTLNSGSFFIQNLLFDTYGHVTGVSTALASGTGINTDTYATNIVFNSGNNELVLQNNDSSTVTGVLSGVIISGDNVSFLNNDAGYITGFTETLTSLTGDSVNTKLIYTDENGVANDIDLSWAIDDTNLSRLVSGSIDSSGIAIFTRDDASFFTVDFSVLFDDTNLSRITSGNFDTSSGILTLTRELDDTSVSVNFDGRYLQSYTETDPIFTGSPSYNITTGDITNWNDSYGWGDHSLSGYLVSGDNISLLTNDVGYITSGNFPLSGQLVGDLDLNNYNIIGTGNIIISGDITAQSGYFDVISFNVDDESILSKGQISWDDTEGTMDIGLTDNTTIHIGEHRYFRIRNKTGGILYKGQVVYATGVHSNGLITPDLYVADGTIREVRFMGVILENVNDNNNGYVVDFGHLQDMDLDGSVSNYAVGDETWVAGDILYVHPTVAGKLTKVEPKHSISVAIVLDPGNGNGNGRMFVRPTSYGHLNDNHDVNTSGLLDHQFLVYDSGTDYWQPSSGLYYVDGDLSIGTASPSSKLHVSANTEYGLNVVQTGVTNNNVGLFQFTGGNVGSTSAGSALLRVSSNSSFRPLASFNDTTVITAGGNVGIGTPSPSYKLDIRYPAGDGMALIKDSDSNDGLLFGDMAYSVSNTYQGIKHVGMTGSSDYMLISEGTNTFMSAKGTAGKVYIRGGGNYGSNQILVYGSSGYTEKAAIELDAVANKEIVVNQQQRNVDFRVESDTDEYLLFTDASAENIGIGTSSPTEKLTLDGSLKLGTKKPDDQPVSQSAGELVILSDANAKRAIACNGDGRKIAATFVYSSGGQKIKISEDGGKTWSEKHTGSISESFAQKGSMSVDGRVIAFVFSVIKISTDGGETWNSYDPDSTFGDYYGVTVSRDGRAIVAAHHGGKIWITLDGGSTWSSGGSASKKWNSVTITDDLQTLYAVASDVISGPDHIYKSTNGGSTWSQISSTADHYYGVDCSSDGTYVLVGRNSNSSNNGVLLVSTNSGSGFTERNTSISGSTVDLNYRNVAVCSDGSRMVASVYGGNFPAKVYYTSDYGTTWEAASTPVNSWWDCDITKDGYKIVASTYQNFAYFNAISHDYSDDIILDNSSQYLSTKNIGAKNILSENILAGQIISNGNVGIGTASPDGKLHIKSEIVDQYHLVLEDDSTSNIFQIGVGDTAGVISVDPTNTNASSNLQFHVDGSSKALFGTSTNFFYQPVSISASNNSVSVGNTSTVFNEDGNDIDFRVEGSGDPNLLFTDASTDRVGIGTANPTVNLEIGSNTSTPRALSVRYSSVPAYISNGFDGAYSRAVFSTNIYNTSDGSFSWSSPFANTNYSAAAIDLTTNAFGGGSQIRFYTATTNNTQPTERMHIDGDGNVGIGTSASVTSRFQVEGGDVTFNDNGGTYNFRVEGDADQYLLYVRGSAGVDKVGVGTASLYGKLNTAQTTTNQSNQQAFDIRSNNYSTSNGQYYTFGEYIYAKKYVNTGIADTGYTIGTEIISALADEGSLSAAFGLRTYAGINQESENGNLAAAYGVQSRVINYSQGTGNINTARGIDVYINGDLNSPGNGGITNAYGVYIQSILNSTNTYGLYQVGSSDKNYFAGDVGIGTASPSAKLNVENGDVAFNSLNGSYTFKVGSTGRDNLLYVDGTSTDRVGIKTSSPDRDFHVNGETHLDGTTIIGTGLPSLGYRLTVDGNAKIDQLNINGNFTFPTTDGSADQVLVTNGSGALTWQDQQGAASSSNYIYSLIFR